MDSSAGAIMVCEKSFCTRIPDISCFVKAHFIVMLSSKVVDILVIIEDTATILRSKSSERTNRFSNLFGTENEVHRLTILGHVDLQIAPFIYENRQNNVKKVDE